MNFENKSENAVNPVNGVNMQTIEWNSVSCAKSISDEDEIASLLSVNLHSNAPSINKDGTSDTFRIKKPCTKLINRVFHYLSTATFIMMAKSQILVEWICEDTNTMGNCSTIPRITDLLHIISDNSDNYEYTDLHYCPFAIAERYGKCMESYVRSCETYMSEAIKKIFSSYMPEIVNAETLCTKGRPYKKEFRDHVACTKELLNADQEWEQHVEIHELKYEQNLDAIEAHKKCQFINSFWYNMVLNIRKKCGRKTERFSREVLSNMWPLSMYSVATLMMLAKPGISNEFELSKNSNQLIKSGIVIDWICEETTLMGNCSTTPKLTDWLEILSDKIFTDEYTDFNYCPFEIVERHARCMKLYVKRCQKYVSEEDRFASDEYNSRKEENPSNLCIEGRSYKKEFIDHTTCTNAIFGINYDEPWTIHQINQEVEFGLVPKKTDILEKCSIVREYWHNQMTWIRKKCGVRTLKFSRQVLSHMWPLMSLMSMCQEPLSMYGYIEI
ncbi:hypothetical protein ACI65C_009145 [Semiaphis heraclei]